jgi:RimJ/RimL family protein N-acetyltransferase
LIELRDISMDDLALYESMVTDPTMMAELGGPLPRDGLRAKLSSLFEDVEAGRIWYFTIVPESVKEPVGTVCIWPRDWQGKTINEVGWMLLPSFQGRGLASEAVGLTLERARAEERWNIIHAFPGVTNGPSNGICRKLAFTKVEEVDVEYVGRPLRCNHWVLDLRDGEPV